MQQSKRRLGIPIVMLWALAHGMWMGATWHAAEVARPAPISARTLLAACGCKHSTVRAIAAQQIRAAKSAPASCEVCQLGALAPDVPVAAAPSLTPPPVRPLDSPAPPVHCIARIQIDLPPGRAPPFA